jgi:hypothetical protein
MRSYGGLQGFGDALSYDPSSGEWDSGGDESTNADLAQGVGNQGAYSDGSGTYSPSPAPISPANTTTTGSGSSGGSPATATVGGNALTSLASSIVGAAARVITKPAGGTVLYNAAGQPIGISSPGQTGIFGTTSVTGSSSLLLYAALGFLAIKMLNK